MRLLHVVLLGALTICPALARAEEPADLQTILKFYDAFSDAIVGAKGDCAKAKHDVDALMDANKDAVLAAAEQARKEGHKLSAESKKHVDKRTDDMKAAGGNACSKEIKSALKFTISILHVVR